MWGTERPLGERGLRAPEVAGRGAGQGLGQREQVCPSGPRRRLERWGGGSCGKTNPTEWTAGPVGPRHPRVPESCILRGQLPLKTPQGSLEETHTPAGAAPFPPEGAC